MQQIGIVQQVEGDKAWVTGDRASTCGSCAGKSSCATLGAWNQRTLELEVRNELGAKAGDEVVIEVPDHLVLKSAYQLYGLPMLFFFIAGITAYHISGIFGLSKPDLWAAVSGIAAIVIYYMSGTLEKSERMALDAHIVHIQTSHKAIRLECHTLE
ncbi:MAG: SoxR reducing system RseC family protein [Mariprofundaceae bacterium]